MTKEEIKLEIVKKKEEEAMKEKQAQEKKGF
jgi:hypothetical protein